MAKTEAQKRAEVMKKEWWKSRAIESSINDLVGLGVLHNKALGGWRVSDLESFPGPQPLSACTRMRSRGGLRGCLTWQIHRTIR
jgi:hypothetical protein